MTSGIWRNTTLMGESHGVVFFHLILPFSQTADAEGLWQHRGNEIESSRQYQGISNAR
jgi:hypothetical protein